MGQDIDNVTERIKVTSAPVFSQTGRWLLPKNVIAFLRKGISKF